MYKEVTYKNIIFSIDLCHQVFFLLSSFIFDRRCNNCDTEWWRIKYIYVRRFCVTGISSSYACSSTSNGSISKSNGKTGIRRKKTYTMLNKVGLLSFRNIFLFCILRDIHKFKLWRLCLRSTLLRYEKNIIYDKIWDS